MRAWQIPRMIALLSLLATLALGLPARAVVAHASLQPSAVYTAWLRAPAGEPLTLYVGGTYRCQTPLGNDRLDQVCSAWVERSTDGGATWSSLSVALGSADPHATTAPVAGPDAPSYYCPYRVGPIVVDPSGQQPATEVSGECYTPSSGYRDVLYSPDGGAHWPRIALDPALFGGYDGGMGQPVFSGLPPYHLFAVGRGSESVPIVVAVLDGQQWRDRPSPAGAAASDPIAGLVPDAVNPNGVYANMDQHRDGTRLVPPYVAHSGDLGKTWTPVPAPQGVSGFAVVPDPGTAGALIATTSDAGTPADRRYYTADRGAQWTVGTCPGARGGRCPRFTLQGGFGAGSSYAILPDGVYAYQGHGPAARRMPIALPVVPSALLDVAGGVAPDDPVYLLVHTSVGKWNGLLYRSVDHGATWQRLTPDVLPVAQAPAATPGSIRVAATGHSVHPAFVSTYRRLGLQTIGYPIDQAFSENGVLTQDFERLRLERHGGTVSVAALGSIAVGFGIVPLGRIPTTPVPPVSSTATRRYVATTRHTLSGAFLSYWLAHGGQAVLGLPISEPFTASNGDGSGRRYYMQYFQNARLEAHPEAHGPRYAVELGLLGVESARARGWLTSAG